MFIKHKFIHCDWFTDTFSIYIYKDDSKLNLRISPKWTHSYIYDDPFEKMIVKLVEQLITESIAAGMQTYIALGKLQTTNTIHKRS